MLRILSTCFLGLLLVGCGGGGAADMPELGTVTGVVTVGGKPLAGALVTFTPEAGRPSTGKTGADGTYSLQYTAEHAGAAVGKHVVTLGMLAAEGSYESGAKAEAADNAPSSLPTAAADRSLTKDVVAGPNTFDISL